MTGEPKRRFRTRVTILSAAAVVWLIPVVWMVSLSFQPNGLLARTTAHTALGLLPYPFTAENYARLFAPDSAFRWFLNSVVVSTGMTALVLALSSLAGYALARIRFPGRTLVYALVSAGLVIPEQAVFIPLYTMFADWGLHNTYAALIAPRLATPVGVFLMTQYFRGVPADIEEAAALDGAGRWTTFRRIMLPPAVPALTALGLLTFLYAWNDYLWPLVSTQRSEMYTITVGLAGMQGNFAESEGLGGIMASGVAAGAPAIALFLLFQQFIVNGIAIRGRR